ncbi:MAG: T9SS type A sorting domain-containing protein [Bacteroidetes bacterium]|nr:T9SS type A sorting domain-containing protein [Bacteroidota bacterium]
MFFTNVSLLFVLLFSLQTATFSQGDKKSKTGARKITDKKTYTFLDINNIATYFYNNGKSDITPNGNSGFEYPKGTGKHAVFASSLLWGAKVAGDPDPRVGGTAYRTALKPGIVQSDGTPADPTSDKYRIYRVRPDVYPGGPLVDLTSDAETEGTTSEVIRADYEKDWTEWPVDLGAPFTDKNNNGTYEPSVDVPGFPGADQTIWFVANDLNQELTTKLYGAIPLGIEIQATIWAYNKPGALSNMLFRKYKIINKTNVGSLTPITFEDMYVTMWADIDLGEAGDDFIGTDSILSLLYSYNANAVDGNYSPLPPPAIGFDFIQGPLIDGIAGQDKNKNGVDDASEFAIFNGQKVGPGKINLPMTAAWFFAGGDPNWGDPPQGTIDGSRQFYNFMRGRYGISGERFIDFVTKQPTSFAFSGNPQAGTGWVDGMFLPGGDRRSGSASGPFNLAPGEMQEIVIAEIIGGAIPGSDRLSAIGILKYYSKTAQQLYDNLFQPLQPPPSPEVKVVELNNKIILDWGEDFSKLTETESFNQSGFTFQGYNVYQLPSPTSTLSEAKRIATFDRIDGVGKIIDSFFDIEDGTVINKIIQSGNDSGIKRSFTITSDTLRGGAPLINGIKYYFAVTAYNYNPSRTAVPNNLESPLKILTVVPHSTDPGITQSNAATLTVTHSKGNGDADIDVKVVNPDLLTGHKYEVFFKDQDYVNDADGKWHKVGTSTKRDGKNKLAPTDISPSSMSFSAVFGDVAHTLDIKGILTIISPDFDFADGVRLDFPQGVTINSADRVHCSVRGDDQTAQIIGQTILWGDSSRSTFGCFSGGEKFNFKVSGTIPFDVNWTIYDDGYGDLYAGTTLGIIDAHGTFSLITAFALRITQHQWAVKDLDLGEIILDNQTVFDGRDWYFGTGPGGSSGNLLGNNSGNFSRYNNGDLGSNYAVTVEGFQVAVNGKITFDSPKTFISKKQTVFGGTTKLGFWGDAQLFGFPTGLTFYSSDFSGVLPVDLIQDLEFRFTGEAPDNDSPVTSGGSIAVGYDRSLAFSAPIRIPFELWEPERNRQINVYFVSRNADGAAPWGDAGTVTHYRMTGRDYIQPYVTDYDENVTSATVGINGNQATWLLFFLQSGDSQWSTGDVFLIKYANNIIPGKDKYEFTTTAKNFNSEKAKLDIEKINVFPNPFYVASTGDLNSLERAVTFSHLPVKAKIRIFNLAGQMVRTLDKDNSSQFFKWDLMNDNNSLVASGVYIAFVEMPEIGETKIIKFAIIQGETVIRKF